MNSRSNKTIATLMVSGKPQEITELLLLLMGGMDAGSDMWKQRAHLSVLAVLTALCDLRDQKKITLTPQLVREQLHLGWCIPGGGDSSETAMADRLSKQAKIATHIRMLNADMSQAMAEAIGWALVLSDEDQRALEGKTGLIPLYFRALRCEMSKDALRCMQAFMETLPGFSLEKAIMRERQPKSAMEQVDYLAMQISKALGTWVAQNQSVRV